MRHTGGGEGLRRGQRHTRLAVIIANEPSCDPEADTVMITNNYLNINKQKNIIKISFRFITL